jgi:hypothetical protein
MVNSYAARVRWWKHICNKHGHAAVSEWYASLPLKVKERFD